MRESVYTRSADVGSADHVVERVLQALDRRMEWLAFVSSPPAPVPRFGRLSARAGQQYEHFSGGALHRPGLAKAQGYV
jgi:hypothetical protein